MLFFYSSLTLFWYLLCLLYYIEWHCCRYSDLICIKTFLNLILYVIRHVFYRDVYGLLSIFIVFFYTFSDKKRPFFTSQPCSSQYKLFFIHFTAHLKPLSTKQKSILFYVNGLVSSHKIFILTLHNRLYNILDVP